MQVEGKEKNLKGRQAILYISFRQLWGEVRASGEVRAGTPDQFNTSFSTAWTFSVQRLALSSSLRPLCETKQSRVVNA